MNTKKNRDLLSPKQINRIIFTILSLYPLVGMGIDLIAPSLPAISRELMTSDNFSKNLITFYLIGYMLGNFVIGFLSDAFGRRKLMLYGFVLFTLFSILPALYSLPFILLAARFFQGIGLAAFAISSRAILSDILPENQLIRTTTLLATMWGIGPIIGPMIGGYLQFYFSWQACFYFYAAFGLLALIGMVFILPETHFHRQPLLYQQLKTNFLTIISHRNFLGMIILMGVAYSSLIVFSTLGPFFIQEVLGYSSVFFGKVALFMGVTFLAGTVLCRQLLKHFKPDKIFFYAILLFSLIAFLTVIITFYYEKNRWAIIIPSLLMFFGSGIIYPTAMGKGLSLFRNYAGSGAAIMNLVSISVTSLISFIMSFIYADEAMSINLIYFCLMLLALIIYYLLIREKPKS